MNLPHQHHHH